MEHASSGVVFLNDQLLFDPEAQQLVSKDKTVRYSVFSRIRIRAEAQSATDFRYGSTNRHAGAEWTTNQQHVNIIGYRRHTY